MPGELTVNALLSREAATKDPWRYRSLRWRTRSYGGAAGRCPFQHIALAAYGDGSGTGASRLPRQSRFLVLDLSFLGPYWDHGHAFWAGASTHRLSRRYPGVPFASRILLSDFTAVFPTKRVYPRVGVHAHHYCYPLPSEPLEVRQLQQSPLHSPVGQDLRSSNLCDSDKRV